MDALFRIETDRIFITWSQRGKVRPVLPGIISPPGYLKIRPRQPDVAFRPETWRADVPEGATQGPEQDAGPRLFEETDYSIFLQSRNGEPVHLQHRDPL